MPYPNVPEAVKTGFRNLIPQTVVGSTDEWKLIPGKRLAARSG